jgi:hypothetical protein
MRLGKIYEKTANYNLSQYQEIIDHHNDGIYIDEALFFSAEIYKKKVERNRYKRISTTRTSTLWKQKKLQAIGETLIYKRLTV